MTDTTTVPVKVVKSLAIKQEFGRRRNNKTRKAAGEKVVRTKAYYLAALSAEDVKALEAGNTVRKTYKSGRVEDYILG